MQDILDQVFLSSAVSIVGLVLVGAAGVWVVHRWIYKGLYEDYREDYYDAYGYYPEDEVEILDDYDSLQDELSELEDERDGYLGAIDDANAALSEFDSGDVVTDGFGDKVERSDVEHFIENLNDELARVNDAIAEIRPYT